MNLKAEFHTHNSTFSDDPFPHWVFDDFMDKTIAEILAKSFPKADSSWYKYDNIFEKKRAQDNLTKIPAYHATILSIMNTRIFIELLEATTGLRGLLPDPWFRGGGLHQILPGGKLDIHADFNFHHHLKLKRKLNVILYLNKHWREEWGGHLELWNDSMTECKKKILPIYNRLVIFETGEKTYHGHPEPLMCPIGTTRNSMALYFYQALDKDELITFHSTKFQKRPQDESNNDTERLRELRNKGRLDA